MYYWVFCYFLGLSLAQQIEGWLHSGRRFNPRDQNNTQCLEISKKWRYCLWLPNSKTFAWLRWPRVEIVISSPVGYIKTVSSITTFVLNILTLKPFFWSLMQLPTKYKPTQSLVWKNGYECSWNLVWFYYVYICFDATVSSPPYYL